MNDKIYEWGRVRGITIYRFFGVAAFIMGIVYSIIIPVGQIPDESTHVQMIEEEFGIEGYADEMVSKYYKNIEVLQIISDADKKVDLKLYFDNILLKFSEDGKKVSLYPNIRIVRHLPSGLGFYFGILLGLPIFFCLQLAELCSVIFYVFMGILTLKIIPIKKELMCAIMLLPMTLQQCSSVSYDSVLLPCCFLLIALIFHYKYRNKKIAWKEIFYLFILLVIISLIKAPYAILILLIFILPFQKFDLKLGKTDVAAVMRKNKWIILIGIICIGCLAFFMLPDVVTIKIIKASFLEMRSYLRVLYCTIVQFTIFYCQSLIGIFGWLNVPLSNIFYILVCIVLIILSQCGDVLINIKERGVFIFVFGTISLLIFTALISHSFLLAGFDYSAGLEAYRGYMREITYSLGIQGRYFLPYIFIFFLLLSGIKHIKEEKVIGLQILFYAVSFLYPTIVVLQYYWI